MEVVDTFSHNLMTIGENDSVDYCSIHEETIDYEKYTQIEAR